MARDIVFRKNKDVIVFSGLAHVLLRGSLFICLSIPQYILPLVVANRHGLGLGAPHVRKH
jgi:hypothetical protein